MVMLLFLMPAFHGRHGGNLPSQHLAFDDSIIALHFLALKRARLLLPTSVLFRHLHRGLIPGTVNINGFVYASGRKRVQK